MTAEQGVVDLVPWLRTQALHVARFWAEHAVDDECGGYWLDLKRDGSRFGDGCKWSVVQWRTVYTFCLAYQMTGDACWLDLAAHGVRFLRQGLRDEVHGGWFFSVTRDGSCAGDDTKQPYALAFASYALAEYARLADDESALADAIETQELVMARSWDHQRAGLPISQTRQWGELAPGKRIDILLHTMEGLSALYHATGDERYAQRLDLLVATVMGRVGETGCYDPLVGVTRERFLPDWTEDIAHTKGVTNAGHVVEAAWFLAKWALFSGTTAMFAQCQAMVDWALDSALSDDGGLYSMVDPVTGEIADPRLIWWNQAELLGALALFYRETGEERYLAHLERLVAFLDSRMIDHEYGEWYGVALPGAGDEAAADKGSLNKGSAWKSGYHVMQGLYHAQRELVAARDGIARTPGDWSDYCL